MGQNNFAWKSIVINGSQNARQLHGTTTKQKR